MKNDMKFITIIILLLCASSSFSEEIVLLNSTLHLTKTMRVDAELQNENTSGSLSEGHMAHYEILFKNNEKYILFNPSINIALGDGEVFVPGSLECDVMKPLLLCASHRSGENLLHWNIYGTVKPGESGTVYYSVQVK